MKLGQRRRGRAGVRPHRRARHRLQRARRQVPVQPGQRRLLVRPEDQRRLRACGCARSRARRSPRRAASTIVGHTSHSGPGADQRRALAQARAVRPPAPRHRGARARRRARAPRAWAFARTSSAAAPTTASTCSIAGSSSRSFPAADVGLKIAGTCDERCRADDDEDAHRSAEPGLARARATRRRPRDRSAGRAPARPRRAALQPGHALPLGTRLRDYEITGLIGEGGFGIVYLAWDHSLQRKVAIKEYMPASMAARVSGSSAIVVKSERHLETFEAGLKSFVNEARLLAQLRPSVAGQGLPLLGGERHRLHGDAVLRRADAEGGARRARPRAERGRAARLAAAAARRARGDARGAVLPPRHRARQHPAHAARRRCCSTSARRGASSAT